MRTCSDVLLPD